MFESSFRGFAVDCDLFAPLCSSIPSLYLSHNDFSSVAAILSQLVVHAHEGVLPVSAQDRRPDAFASLWFIRAAHLFAEADRLVDDAHRAFIVEQLLPLTKKILQQFIATAVGGVRMDDGGLLILPPERAADTLRINALWYSALESSAADFKAHKDRVGDHFERLAGRFRRSFIKAYWCDAHSRICTPEARALPDHGQLPDPEQLLLAFLPESPIPRTKQRQLLQLFRAASLGSVGLRFEHPAHGVIESPLYRAWLMLSFIHSADTPAAGIADAAAISAPLVALRPQAHATGLPAWYRDGEPLPGQAADPLTTAEVLGALNALK